MRADFRVFLDACVLAHFGVCDLLLRLSERPRLIVPCWSSEVLAEVRRVQTGKLGWPTDLADSFNASLHAAFPDAVVSDYQGLIATLTNDPEDRHVLAAAIRGQCPLILTFNLKHFPAHALRPWNISASHPQEYLLVLYEMESAQMLRCLGEIAGRRKLEVQDVLIRLGKVLPRFAQRVLDDLS